MKLSEAEAYKRFPVKTLTQEWVQRCGHIDFFESDDPQYAIKRLLAAVSEGASGVYNAAVWIPTCERYKPANDVMDAVDAKRGVNSRWTLDAFSSCWSGSAFTNASYYMRNGPCASPDTVFSEGVAAQVTQMRDLLMAEPNVIAVESALCLDHTHAHFASSENAQGVGAPHVDGHAATGRINVRLVEMYSGAGTYIIPNDCWKDISADQSGAAAIDWARIEAEEIAPLLQVPDNAVVSFTTAKSAVGKPVLHGAPVHQLVNGVPQQQKRLNAIYTIL